MDQKPGEKILDNGAKARQRADNEDRNLPFSNALRKYFVPSTDVDFVVTDGQNRIRLVLEVTRPDEKVYSETNYLESVDIRRSSGRGNNNDAIIREIARKLGTFAILVVFEPTVSDDDESPIWFRSMNGKEWKKETAKEFFEHLRRYAVGKV